MTKSMKFTGIIATLAIVFVIPIYTWFEPAQQDHLLTDHYSRGALSATDLYAQNCAICHGAGGEGIGENPPLNSESVQMMSETDLAKVIARGRDSSLMAAWAVEEGGIFSNPQINDFVILIQIANWDYVETRVAELGLTPPAVIEMEIPEALLKNLSELPEGDILSAGLTVYAENCAACHGSNGSGTVIAPAIDTPDLRQTPVEELVDLVTSGVSGTLMAGWDDMLEPTEITAVIHLILRWPDLVQAGVDFPEVEVMTIPTSPELMAAGNQLFNIACKSCHGVDGYGSPMAPAVNNQLFLSETPDAAIYQIIAGGIPGTLMPAWGSRLNDQEIQSLVAFLRGQEPSAPAILPPILDP